VFNCCGQADKHHHGSIAWSLMGSTEANNHGLATTIHVTANFFARVGFSSVVVRFLGLYKGLDDHASFPQSHSPPVSVTLSWRTGSSKSLYLLLTHYYGPTRFHTFLIITRQDALQTLQVHRSHTPPCFDVLNQCPSYHCSCSRGKWVARTQ
jgi:hypothetical protein